MARFLCVGGLADGRLIEMDDVSSRFRTIRVMGRLPMPVIHDYDAHPASIDRTPVEAYRPVPFHVHEDKGLSINILIPDTVPQDESGLYALTRLVNNYQPEEDEDEL